MHAVPRHNNFDIIRLFAALMIFAYHPIIWYTQQYSVALTSLQLYILGRLGHAAVAIFFAVSGYLITLSILRDYSIGTFIIKRIARVLPAQVCVTLCIALLIGPVCTSITIQAYFSSVSLYQFIVLESLIIANAKTLPGLWNGTIITSTTWSLFLEVKLYILVMLLSILGFYNKKFGYLIFCIGYTLCIVIIPSSVISKLLHINIAPWYSYSYIFVISGLYAVYKHYVPISWPISIVLSILFYYCPISWPVHQLLEALFYVNVVLCIAYKFVYTYSIKYDISYGIFLWHTPINLILFHNFNYNGSPMYLLLCSALCTLACALLSHILVELPCKKILYNQYVN